VTQLYGPAVRCKLNLQSGGELVLRFCIRPLRGADRSWPSWISARVRSHSRIGPQRPVGSPDHERDGETVPVLIFRTSALKNRARLSVVQSWHAASRSRVRAFPRSPARHPRQRPGPPVPAVASSTHKSGSGDPRSATQDPPPSPAPAPPPAQSSPSTPRQSSVSSSSSSCPPSIKRSSHFQSSTWSQNGVHFKRHAERLYFWE
jgi:hypothetical protein